MQERAEIRQQPSKRRLILSGEPSLQMRQEDIESFMDQWRAGHKAGPAKRYYLALMKLYGWLPEDKLIRRGTVDRWLEELRDQGYSRNTLNYFGAVSGCWLKYMGVSGEIQRRGRFQTHETSLPAPSREEYHRLLTAAKELRNERSYLLIKLFAATGILGQDLPRVTVEAAQAGELEIDGEKIHLPSILCRELLSYASYNRIEAGPVFICKTGETIQPTGIGRRLKEVSQAAGLPQGKGTPSSLRKLCQNTKAELRKGAVPEDKALDALLEREQAVYGWGV